MQEVESIKQQYSLAGQETTTPKTDLIASSKVLPNAGKYGILTAIGIAIVIGGVSWIKYSKFRDIK